MADELENDVALLFDCMKCQLDCPTALKEALLALANLCNREGEPVKYYIRKCSGLKFIFRILTTVRLSDVQMAALYALGCAVEHYVYSQQELSTVDLFNTLQNILNTHNQKPGLLRTCCYLMLAVVNNNNLGQALVRDTGCLECLLTLFKKTLPGNRDEDVTSDDKSTSMELWSTVSSAISVCVNNPRNAHNQDRVAQCGGLSILLNCLHGLVDRLRADTDVCLLHTSIQALVGCLDAVLTENSENSDKLGRLGIVTALLHLLRNASLPTDTRLQVVIALGHCTDTSDKNRLKLVQLDGMSTLIQELTYSCNEELSHAIKYILQTCVSVDSKSATMMNVHNFLGRQGVTMEFSRKGLSCDDFTLADILVDTDNRKFCQDNGLTSSRPAARTDGCALSLYHTQITRKLDKLESMLERCHQQCPSGSVALSDGLHQGISSQRGAAEAEDVWASASKADVSLNQGTGTNKDGSTGLCLPADTAKNGQTTGTQCDSVGRSCQQMECTRHRTRASRSSRLPRAESPVCKFIFTSPAQCSQSSGHKRVHQSNAEPHSTDKMVEVQDVGRSAKQILFDSNQSVKRLGLQGVHHSAKDLTSGNQCLGHTVNITRSRSLCDAAINDVQQDDRRNRVSGQCPRRNTILEQQENCQLRCNQHKSAPGITNIGRKPRLASCISSEEVDVVKQTSDWHLSECNVFDKPVTTLELAPVGRSEVVSPNNDRRQPAVANGLELDFTSEKNAVDRDGMESGSVPHQRKKETAWDPLQEDERRKQHVWQTMSKMSVIPTRGRRQQVNTQQSPGTFVKPTRPVPRRAARRRRSAPDPSANSQSRQPSRRRSSPGSITGPSPRRSVTRTASSVKDRSLSDDMSFSESCCSLAQSTRSDRHRKEGEGDLLDPSQPSDVSQTQQISYVSISELADVNTMAGHKKVDVKDKCPGCQPPSVCQLPILNSRTYNIAIETSCYTCTFHRQLREEERAFIRRVRQNNPSCGRLPRRTRSAEMRDGTEAAKQDVYECITDSDSLDEGAGYVTPPHCIDVTPSRSVGETADLPAGSSSRRRPRVPYTNEEVTALVRGVATKGRSWKDILHSYRFHPSRTAVDLKDKYRRLMAKQTESSVEAKSSTAKFARPFSMAEVRRLKRGVRLYGHNWKAILCGFRFSHGRTSTELRDKWRSIHRHR